MRVVSVLYGLLGIIVVVMRAIVMSHGIYLVECSRHAP